MASHLRDVPELIELVTVEIGEKALVGWRVGPKGVERVGTKAFGVAEREARSP